MEGIGARHGHCGLEVVQIDLQELIDSAQDENTGVKDKEEGRVSPPKTLRIVFRTTSTDELRIRALNYQATLSLENSILPL
eukprot:772584-Prorocentrum_minimum.AAC.1